MLTPPPPPTPVLEGRPLSALCRPFNDIRAVTFHVRMPPLANCGRAVRA
jgi:hypothetical protein